MNKLRQFGSRIYRYFNPLTPVEMYQRMGVKIGKNCKIQFDVNIDYSHYWLIEIGNDVTIAPRVHILAHDASTKLHLGYTRIGRVRIDDGVFIGAGSIILPGVHIGANSIIAAGSVVTKDVPPNSVWGGNPARLINTLEAFLQKRSKELESSSKFGEDYTLRGAISSSKKAEMVQKLEHGFGYVE